MSARLQITLKPLDPEQSAALADRAWAVLKQQGLTEHATHFTLGYRSRGTPLAKLGRPLLGGHEALTVFDGPKTDESTLRVWVKFRREVEVDLTWRAAPDDLFARCEALAVALDEALGTQGWFVFSALSARLSDSARLRPSPARWHRWLHGSRMLDILDTRLPGVVDTLREIPLPDGVRWRQVGHLVFVRWSPSPTAADLGQRLRDREQFLAETFAWGLESINGYPPPTPAHIILPFPEATNARHLGPPDELPWSVGELVKAVRRRHNRKAERLLGALSAEHVAEALGPMCRLGHRPSIDALLAAGADIHHVGVQGWSALMLACLGRSVEIVAMLLAQGAAVGLRGGRDAVTALHVAAGETGEEWAARRKGSVSTAKASEIIALLVAAGAPLDVQDRNGNTAFHLAVSDGRFGIAEQLLVAGADPLLRDAEAASALELMAVRGSIAALSRMLALHAERSG